MPAEVGAPTIARENERGSIAILALWGVALIFMLLVPVSFLTHSELQVAHNAIAASRARLAAEAGTQLGLARLLRRHDGTAYFDGTAETWLQGSTHVSIAIIDEAGKIDLNLAPQDFLAGLFAAVGRSREEAQLLACNVLDRRGDPGTGCPEPGGAQLARRFTVPEELAQVPGIDDDLYDRIADSITVTTAASAIDPRVAPRLVLMAIPGATDSMVDAFLQSRASWRDMSAAGGPALLTPTVASFLMATPGRDFTIAATATTTDGARYRAELQVRLTERPAAPYQVMGWRAPPADRGRQIAPPAPSRVP
jgi:general secretion pathway protein K